MNDFRALSLCAAAIFLAEPCAAGTGPIPPPGNLPLPADNQSPWAGYGSIGVGLLPDYDGSKDYLLLPYAEARLNYDNYYARFEGGALRFNLVDDETFHAGPLMGFRRGRHGVDSPSVSKLPRFDDTETVGGFLEWEHEGDDPRYGESVTLSIDDSVTDQPSGWAATLRADMRRPVEAINPGFIVSVEGDVSWGSRAFMRTYYTVTPAGSAASGLPVFDAGAGISQIGAAFCVDQFLSRHWSIGARFHYARQIDAAASSPVTAIAGSANQYFTGLVVGYVL